MSCPTVTTIQPTECIGNSLNTINANYQSLRTGVCDNQDQINFLRTLLLDLSANLNVLPVGSVVNTHYVELVGPQTRSGNTLDQNSFSDNPDWQMPTLATGHEILSKTVRLSNPNNYFIIQADVSATSDGGAQILAMIFAGSTLIAAQSQEDGFGECFSMTIKHAPGNLNDITYSYRAANRTGNGPLNINKNVTLNGRYPTFWPTGKTTSTMIIQEIKG
jgi:hypothetical protein